MTPLLVLTIAIAGGLGSGLRFVLDSTITRRLQPRRPLGTAVINVTGSLALGILTGATPHLLDSTWLAILGTGLIGGYTTFSTASIEAVRLLLQRRIRDSVTIGFAPLVLSTAAAWGGFLFGRSI